MGLVITETQGDSLQGEIDGVNRTYVTTCAFVQSTVTVLIDAVPSTEFTTQGNRTVVLDNPLSAGTLAVQYEATDEKTGGGADGGVPAMESSQLIQPEGESMELLPDGGDASVLRTRTETNEVETRTDATNLRPVMVREGNC